MSDDGYKVGEIFAAADYGSYPRREFFQRAERKEGITLGPMKRSKTKDPQGRTVYICEAEVIAVAGR